MTRLQYHSRIAWAQVWVWVLCLWPDAWVPRQCTGPYSWVLSQCGYSYLGTWEQAKGLEIKRLL